MSTESSSAHLEFDPARLGVAREILDLLGAAPNKTMGQNFLVNSGALDKIAATAKLNKDDTILEVGPGLGALSVRLLRDGGRIVAIEKDAKYAAFLERQFAPQPFTLIHGDALDLKWEDLNLPDGTKVVANLPYSISKPMLRRIYEEWRPHLQSATLLVQREVALRMISEPGTREYGPLSIMAHLYSRTKRVFDIAPGSFYPPPEVTSSVIHVEFLETPALELRDEKRFWTVVRAAFSQRRKTLGNTMKPLASKEKLAEVWQTTGIDPIRRGETLSIAEFGVLTDALSISPIESASPDALFEESPEASAVVD